VSVRVCVWVYVHTVFIFVCCNVWQCVAMCCSVLQCVAVCCSVCAGVGAHLLDICNVTYSRVA